MKPYTLNIRGRLSTYARPAVMGIINVTPDSFYQQSRVYDNAEDLRLRVRQMIADGADMIDIGGYSSRPGAGAVTTDEELRRLAQGLAAIRAEAPHIPVSVDTFRAHVAYEAVTRHGADIINDISGGDLDPDMFQIVADLKVPYVLMHMRGTPQTMQALTSYPEGVEREVLTSLAAKLRRLSLMGVADVIIDPGFGFAKTLEQNYTLLRNLRCLELLERPALIGVSRKSMLTRALDIPADEALNATTVINTLALDRGAAILRVHDVKAAAQAVKLYNLIT